MKPWHELDPSQVADALRTDGTKGLSQEEAQRRLALHGPNQLRERLLRGPGRILLEQFTSTMVVILILAAVLSHHLGDRKDAAAILVIVALNAALGFRQEYRAQKAIAGLKALAVPVVRVCRAGQVLEIPASAVVPGDLLLLEAGNAVPADARIVECRNLRTQEASLTGESQPVAKGSEPLEGGALALAERRNMVFMGTFVTYGRGRAVVTATGMETELGRIADLIQTVGGGPTPLQKRLAQVGRGLALAALAIVGVVFAIGLARGESVREMFLLAISLAVAAVPEGLPAVVTITLAIGSQRLLSRKALIRKLPAVETLGSVTVICSDKTGTLTENRMDVAAIQLPGHVAKTPPAREPLASCHAEAPGDPCQEDRESAPAALLLAGGALCNDAVLKDDPDGDRPGSNAIGDPTETALLLAAARAGYSKADLEVSFPRIGELPFDSERKRMTTWHRIDSPDSPLAGAIQTLIDPEGRIGSEDAVAFCKGAPDGLLTACTRVVVQGKVQPLGDGWASKILSAADELAGRGMRVLGLGFRIVRGAELLFPAEEIEKNLVFVGLFGLIDPPRPEARSAVALCRSAGVRPVMITGDHPLTALHIAQDLGLAGDGTVLRGDEVAGLTEAELEHAVERVSVYARVSPEHKLRIVQALQKNHHIVAMTGDGVNDAPALKKADIGVAMGVTGTDVSKEVADMVLLDDNFATIVAAVEEGRAIYDNIRKFIKYLLTTNSGELWVMLVGPLLGMPLPLLPLQILWINLVTDGLPALALGVEPAEADIMNRPPNDPRENIFGRGLGRHILWVGILVGCIPLATGYVCWHGQDPRWQTMLFTTLTFCQMSHVLAVRSGHRSLFAVGLLSNKPLLGAVMLTCLLQLMVVYAPSMQTVFRTHPLGPGQLMSCIALSSLIFWAVELEKKLTSAGDGVGEGKFPSGAG